MSDQQICAIFHAEEICQRFHSRQQLHEIIHITHRKIINRVDQIVPDTIRAHVDFKSAKDENQTFAGHRGAID